MAFFGLIFSAFGVFFLWLTHRYSILGKASLLWPAVNGEVLESRVVQHRNSNGGVKTSPRIKYCYDVQGQRYESSQITFAFQSTNNQRARAESLVEEHPAGREVTVYYNPEKHSQSVLQPGEGSAGAKKVFQVVSVVFICLGIGMAFFF